MSAAAAAAAATSMSDQVPPARQRVTIVGGGPAGALMALYLSQQGRSFEVDLFEREKEDRIYGPTVQSYNVVVLDRGTGALEAGGFNIQTEVGDTHVAMTGSVRHHAKNKTSPYFVGRSSVCRGDLAKALLNKASKMPNVNVHYDSAFSKMDMEKGVATFERGNGDIVESGYDMLVGADGSNSRVRKSLEENVPGFTVRQNKDSMAFKTILIPIMGMEGADESWTTRFQVINSKIGCLGGAPRSDGMSTAVVILPREGKDSFGALMKTTQDVRDFFSKNFPQAFGSGGPSDEIAKDFLERKPRSQRSTYCSSLTHERTVLIGDAAHSMLASLGQGVNAALEDCQVLAQVLDSATEKEGMAQPLDIPTVLETYNEKRFEDAQAACTLSEIGMGGSRTVRPAFAAQMLLIVILNKTLGRLFPKVFQPPALMSMMGKKPVPYGVTLRGVKRQAAQTKGLMLAGLAFAVAGVAVKVARKI